MGLALCLAMAWPVCAAEGFSGNADAIERAAASVVKLYIYNASGQQTATGSGFLALDDRTVITNYHVIQGGKRIIAVSDAGRQYEIGGICCSDKKLDVAILRFAQSTGLSPLPLEAGKDIKRGEKIVAIGSPIGIRNTVSLGNISALYEENGVPWIQFTAPISKGSSGGALLNDAGAVIGITSASYKEGQNLNLAVRISAALTLYSQWNGKTLALSGTAAAAEGVQLPESSGTEMRYILNTSSKKFHLPSCKTVAKMRQSNMTAVTAVREELILQGYSPCGICKP